jgi:uncharacterized membrane protein YqjE
MALLFGPMLIVATSWDTHRTGALAAVATGFGLLAVVATLGVRSNARRRSRLLCATVGELERDRQRLANRAP